MQALLGFTPERRWLRHATAHLRHLFPYLPGQSGHNRRLRKAADLIAHINRLLATDTSLWSDSVWVVDSTPVECGRSRETAKRSDLAGWTEYGYCANHSRYFWGLRLHLVCTLHGLPVTFALTGAKADERQTLLGMLHAEPGLVHTRPGQTLIADRHYYGAAFEHELAEWGLHLLPPARKGEPPTGRIRPVQATAAGDRFRQPDLQGPTRPRTPPRPHQERRDSPGPATHPRPDQRDLAQRPHRPTRHALPDRLQPPTLRINHLAGRPTAADLAGCRQQS
ncbi:transposase [Kitasatospora sp. YST-16]|nr:transposase [Kitasatospora sp. YST-16]